MIANTWTIKPGHALDVLTHLPPKSVQCVVTSPPYFGMRSYDTDPVIFGGRYGCDHEWINNPWYRPGGGAAKSSGEAFSKPGPANALRLRAARWHEYETCPKCGAWKGHLGEETDVQLYINHLISIMREVRMVLKDDGVLWVNLGDGYDGKTKNLLGVPWRFALAMQADGWVLRSDVIWHKNNPMPDPTKDRPTRAHEYVFQFTKQPRYAWNRDGAREPAVEPNRKRNDRVGGENGHVVRHSPGGRMTGSPTRNMRTVWTIPVGYYEGAHFATFPLDLPTKCILASTQPGDMVLDPFSGAGTTVLAAVLNDRSGIGIELNPDYVRMSEERILHALGEPRHDERSVDPEPGPASSRGPERRVLQD